MARNLTGAMVTEITAKRLRLILLLELEFTSGVVNIWTGRGDYVWDSKTWAGLGNLLSISPIEETTELRASSVMISVSAIPSAVVARVLSESRQGLPGRIWIGALNDDGTTVIDPYPAFEGRMDIPAIEESGETSIATFQFERHMVDGNRSSERRYTAEDQKSRFPGDLGFDIINSIQWWTGLWGVGSPLEQIPEGWVPTPGDPGSGTSIPISELGFYQSSPEALGDNGEFDERRFLGLDG